MTGSSHVKPKGKGAVIVKLNTTGRTGVLTENVEVLTNDPLRPEITLTIRALVTNGDVPPLGK